jgi:hypothetical protein
MRKRNVFRENKQELQTNGACTLDELPTKHRQRLEASWAGVFYRECFLRIDERPFAVLFAVGNSRPNTPVNVLLGLEALKAGFGWSDASMWDAFCFDLQVRYALGYRNLGEGQFDLRTVYNFRARLLAHMRETGQDLVGEAFAQITDAQIEVLALQTGLLRMDSTLIASNMRNLSRLELLVEVLHRVQRMLCELDQARYAQDMASYVQGSTKQYVYRVSREEGPGRIAAIGVLMGRLVQELEACYAEHPTYQLLRRVFGEHFALEDQAARPKQGPELKADSLASPDDREATYHCKAGQAYKGYTVNISETCAPENPVQLVTLVQSAPNVTNDDDLLVEALPTLKERLHVQEMVTDGGYNSPESYAACQEQGVQHTQTALRGHAPSRHIGLDAFDIATSPAGIPQQATCPQGQQVSVEGGQKPGRYLARFPLSACETCPLRERCLTRPWKRAPYRTLIFDAHDLEIARRRQRIVHDRQTGRNLRAAIESTVGALKHPCGNNLPVRGWFRVNCWMTYAALMLNVRRIQHYQGTAPQNAAAAEQVRLPSPFVDTLVSLLSYFHQLFLASRLSRSAQAMRP